MEGQIIANEAYDYKSVVSNNSITRVDFDADSNLELYCYLECSNSDNVNLKRCRGLVFHQGKLILAGFPYTDEYNISDSNEINQRITNISDWTFYPSYEGSLIRLFYFNNRWFVSTNKKLNAFRSKWSSSKSFGELFEDALLHECSLNETFSKTVDRNHIITSFCSLLNKGNQYMFLIRNNKENRIVCNPPSNDEHHVFHVGTFIDNKLDLKHEIENFPRPEELKFENSTKLFQFISNSNYKNLQGVIAFNSSNEQIKIYNPEYQTFYNTRGNVPSVKFRYLAVRMDKNMVNRMYEIYPEFIETFEKYESCIFEIAQIIHNLYCQKHIKKIFTVAPQDQYNIMKNCHAFHLTNPKKNIVTINVVIKFLNQTPAHILNRMIKDLMFDKNKDNFQRPRSIPNSLTNSPAIVPVINVQKSPTIRPLV